MLALTATISFFLMELVNIDNGTMKWMVKICSDEREREHSSISFMAFKNSLHSIYLNISSNKCVQVGQSQTKRDYEIHIAP